MHFVCEFLAFRLNRVGVPIRSLAMRIASESSGEKYFSAILFGIRSRQYLLLAEIISQRERDLRFPANMVVAENKVN